MHACARGGTYKYFFDKGEVAEVWRRLEAAYGPVRRNETFKTIEIESDRFIFRSTFLANPVTVLRKRKCGEADVEALHALIGYPERDNGPA
ncbi:MAG: hypothetical protein KIT84_30390 [Labilithrix sp.]|nr:hypothetical protein [Labilithrix sp.]MCW5815375.1 hypothetical protein [Labilithrix sp.]